MGTTYDVGLAQCFNWLIIAVAGQSITAHPQKRLAGCDLGLGFCRWIWNIWNTCWMNHDESVVDMKLIDSMPLGLFWDSCLTLVTSMTSGHGLGA